MEAILSVSLMAIATGTAAGLRPYFTVLFLGLVSLVPHDSAPGVVNTALDTIPEQLSNPWALGICGVLAAGEFAVDKWPIIDSGWDTLQGFLRPVFGTLIGSQLGAQHGTEAMIAGAALGGVNALAVGAGKSLLRLVVNMFPEPISNFLLSVSEDVAVVLILVGAIVLPPVAALFGVTMFFAALWVVKHLRRTYSTLRARLRERQQNPHAARRVGVRQTWREVWAELR